jgi:hypothetical protein
MLKVISEQAASEVFYGDVELLETPNGNLAFNLNGENIYVRSEDVDDIDNLLDTIDEWSVKAVIPDDVEDASAFKLLCHQRPWKKIRTFKFS